MAYAIKTSFGKGRVSVGAFKNLTKKKRKKAKTQLNRIGKLLYRRVLLNITKPAMSHSQLNRLGNPYAKSGGRIIRSSKLGGLKSYQIMTRSGDLAKSLDYAVIDSRFGSRQSLYIYFDEEKNDAREYIKSVIKGSNLLVGRDVINETLSKTNRTETIKFMREHIEQSEMMFTQKDIRKILRISK